MAVNAISYIKNVGKSLGYASADYFSQKNPAAKALLDETKDLTAELFDKVRDYKSTAEDIKENKMISENLELVQDLFKNTFSDIKSGKWYNKERKEEVDNGMMNNFFGDDFDFDDDFDLDDDDDDDISGPSIEDSMDRVGSKVSEAVSMATAKSAEHISRTSVRNTKAIMSQNIKLFGQLNAGLGAINGNLSSLVKLGADVNTHIQNSTVFFTKSTELQNRQVELLEKLVENTAPIGKKDIDRGSSYTRIGDVLGEEDILDFREYARAVKDNIENSLSLIFGMGDMLKDENGNGDSIFKSFVASPLEHVLSMAIDNILPKMFKQSMESFNKSLSGFFGSMLMNLNRASSNNTIIDTLLGFLGIHNSLKNKMDTSLYEKGKVDFDGITRKSIVEVIPTYLSKILSTLSGKEEMRYDFSKGKFLSLKEIKEKRDDITRYPAESAGYDLKEAFEEYLGKQEKENGAKKYTKDEQKELIGNLNKFFKTYVEKGELFNYRKKNIKDSYFEKFGLDPKTGKELVQLLKELEQEDKGYIATNLNKEVLLARERISDDFSDLENAGDSIISSLYNNSIDEKALQLSPLNLNNIVDQYHNNVFYYLQGIYQYTRHVSDNISKIGGGGGTAATNNAAVFEAIKAIENNTPKPQSTKKDRKVYTKYEYEDLTKDINRYVMRNNTIMEYEEFANLSDNEQDAYIEKLIEAKRKSLEQKDEAGKLKNAVNSKINSIVDGVVKIFNKPAEIVSDVLGKANNVMLDIIYGREGHEDEGFLGYILYSTKQLFTKLSDWFDVNVLGSFGTSLDNLFGEKGPDGKRHGGWFGELGNNIADNFRALGGWVKDSASGVVGSVKEFFTPASKKPKNTAYDGGMVEKTGLVAVSEGEMIIPSEYNPFYIGKTDKKQQRKNETNIVNRFFGNFADGNLSVGEDPSKLDKAKELFIGTKEDPGIFKEVANAVKDKVETAKYLHSLPEDERNPKKSFEDTKAEYGEYKEPEREPDRLDVFKEKAMEAFIGTKEDPGILREMGSVIKTGLNDVFDTLFISDDEYVREQQEQFKETLGNIISEIGVGKNISAIITGGIVGGGMSLLTGGIVSPLLAASAGGAAGLIIKSERVQELLFGSDKEEGLFDEKVGKFVQEK